MSGSRRFGRLAALASIVALVMGACGGAPVGRSPITSSGSPSASSPAPAAPGPIEYAATADSAAGAKEELELSRQLRDEAGMPALLGKGGADAFAALDALEAKFGEKVLQDAAGLPATARVSGPALGVPLRSHVAGYRRSAAAAALAAMPAADLSIFADTGFTTSALMRSSRG